MTIVYHVVVVRQLMSSLNSGTRRERGRSRHLNQVNDEANVMNSSEASDDLYVKK